MMNANMPKNKCQFISDEILEVLPCQVEGRAALEHTMPCIRKCIDAESMCHLLSSIEGWKCRSSASMGYTRLDSDNKTAHIFANGKIIIRRSKDVDEGRRILEGLLLALWPAVICSRCNNPTFRCLKVCGKDALMKNPFTHHNFVGGKKFEEIKKMEIIKKLMSDCSQLKNEWKVLSFLGSVAYKNLSVPIAACCVIIASIYIGSLKMYKDITIPCSDYFPG